MRLSVKQKQRLYFLIFTIVSLGAALSLILWILKDNVVFFYTPSELLVKKETLKNNIRLGGIVEKNSLEIDPTTLQTKFYVTDHKQRISVSYHGILPKLFREGQGVVVEGQYQHNGIFQGTQVLTKHDENYRPPISDELVDTHKITQTIRGDAS